MTTWTNQHDKLHVSGHSNVQICTYQCAIWLLTEIFLNQMSGFLHSSFVMYFCVCESAVSFVSMMNPITITMRISSVGITVEEVAWHTGFWCTFLLSLCVVRIEMRGRERDVEKVTRMNCYKIIFFKIKIICFWYRSCVLICTFSMGIFFFICNLSINTLRIYCEKLI